MVKEAVIGKTKIEKGADKRHGKERNIETEGYLPVVKESFICNIN